MVFEGKTAACREYTLPREDPGSEIIAWIGGHTKVGPVLQVKTTCRLDIYGIEIQVPLTSGDGPTSWVIISRGSNRYMEDIQYNDPDNSPESHELANHTSVGKPHAILSSNEDSRASQPETQPNVMTIHSEDFIPIDEWKWNDISAYG